MAKALRRPSLINRTMSTPPTTPPMACPSSLPIASPENNAPRATLLTPPTSPRQSKSSSDLWGQSIRSTEHQSIITPFHPPPCNKDLEASQAPDNVTAPATEAECLECPYDIEVLKDQGNREQVFGYGAWSTVYRATTHPKRVSRAGFNTPPDSPIISAPVLVAVKRPARRDAKPILENEAKILSYLSRIPENESFIVPFYGQVLADASIVLAAIPTSLEDHIKGCALAAKSGTSNVSMVDPVIGSSKLWLQLALHLVSALDWLHNEAGAVHGDIKPGNVLLAPKNGSHSVLPFEPVLTDFTSGQLLNAEEIAPNTLSAVTREYTAPELLKSAVLRDPKSTATTDSDVFSMAVTLLVAATGEVMVYPGSMFQRQAMATQGWQILNHVRNGDQGARVPRFGIVERALEKAVLKAGMGRTTAAAWRSHIQEMTLGEPSKL